LRGATAATAGYDRAIRSARAANVNLLAQFQDIGVSLAGGQNPFLVLLQQGSQISYIASQMESGWKGVALAAGKLVLAFAPLIIAVGILAIAFKSLQDSANDDAGLKSYVNTLGLTAKETRKLKDVTVTAGDTIKAVWQVATEQLLGFFGLTTKEVEKFWDTAMKNIVLYTKYGIQAASGLVYAFYRTTVEFVGNIGVAFYNAWQVVKNLASGTADVTTGFKQFAEMSNFADNFKKGGVAAGKAIDDFADKAKARAIKLAKERLALQAKAIIENRSPGAADKTEENRARAIELVNQKLDNELSRMRLLKDEREVQQRMDQIEEQLAGKKIKLNDAERKSIEEKVRAIESYRAVQVESDRIVAEADGPLKKLNATNQAAKDLYASGTITLERYNAEVAKASRAYQEATDPLFRFNEAITAQKNTLGQYGVELEKANYLEQLRLEYQSRGLSMYDESTGKLRDEVAALVAKNDALRQQQFIQSELGSVLNPVLKQSQEVEAQAGVYAELDRLRQADLISEEQYQQTKSALYVKYNESRLNAASDFFGALASVTKGGQGVIGAIGKAAAVAQATIDGYVAVQKALASLPPPFSYVAAAAVAIKTGVQVAGIISTNAGSFATGGQFMVQGKSGVDANNINMNVTRGERVTIETPAQQRANDAKGNGGGEPVVNVPVRVAVSFDPRMALDALDTAAGERVVISIVERNPQAFQRILGSR
jgi:hypothetical protein